MPESTIVPAADVRRNSKLRNLAIIAHVDHGKTTLVDRLMRFTGAVEARTVGDELVLDNNALERERGITILAKNTSIRWNDAKINVIDTPGHADFGGEVERVLKLADSALLVVDAFEGPMPQTRFVLKKAFEQKLRPIVCINKIDRPDARPHEVLDEVFDLFVELGADDEALDFAVCYASGKNSFAIRELDQERKDMRPLLDVIMESVPAPRAPIDEPLQFQVTSLDYNEYVGRIAIGRVYAGILKTKRRVAVLRRDGKRKDVNVGGLFSFEGMERKPVDEVEAGDLCAVQGIENIDIGDTIADIDNPIPMPLITIDEPTISMVFYVNSSPFAGRSGDFLTSRHLRERLYKELQSNVALRVEDTADPDAFKVSGRGTLHLGILIENMRREGFEFAVGKPRPIYREINGKKAEPIEILVVDVPQQHAGKVIEVLGPRRGEVAVMDTKNNLTHLEFHVPSRGLIGLRTHLLTLTQGEAIIHHSFYQYEFFKGSIPHRINGALISMESHPVTFYALELLQDRGMFFVGPQDEVYVGQIVGEHCKPGDLTINVGREKKLTNMRSAGAEKNIRLAPPRVFALEEALEYIDDDELVEVTPDSIRLRKRLLDENDRKKAKRVGGGDDLVHEDEGA
ncbi:MAG: translational GTPase TypA [Planctomycetes bacterium]|nr:translational GTPase TypA [Planctomycetota bacterium]